jgi:hypothetical protein
LTNAGPSVLCNRPNGTISRGRKVAGVGNAYHEPLEPDLPERLADAVLFGLHGPLINAHWMPPWNSEIEAGLSLFARQQLLPPLSGQSPRLRPKVFRRSEQTICVALRSRRGRRW